MPAITRPRGTNDLLPAESGLRQWVLETHRRVAGAHGYELIDTPVFEATEMYERGAGAGTDVVEKEMFSFTDRGGRPPAAHAPSRGPPRGAAGGPLGPPGPGPAPGPGPVRRPDVPLRPAPGRP